MWLIVIVTVDMKAVRPEQLFQLFDRLGIARVYFFFPGPLSAGKGFKVPFNGWSMDKS